ncbi:MAG: glycosyltransferase family 39 protein [Melioribacteraceae bacterium]|nr:glycosyltransferase family 39 protein [Melioribacteraceae bacterium]
MIELNNIIKQKSELLSVLLITIIASIIRFNGLGKWSLAVDEFYITRSIENILEFGIPQFQSGGYYNRGIVYQYLTSLLMLGGIKAEFAVRLIPVLSNIAAIPAIYLLAKKIRGKTLGIAVITVFSLSIWEIEFARFGRMYAPFQTLFLWYVYFLYQNVVENKNKAEIFLYIISAVSVFVYEGGIFLIALNFIPIFLKIKNGEFRFSIDLKNKLTYKKIIISIFILVISFLYLSFNFRTLNESNLLPLEFSQSIINSVSSGKFRIPIIFANYIPINFIWLSISLIVLAASLMFAVYIVRSKNINVFLKVTLFVLLLLSLINLLGLIILVILCAISLNWLKFGDLKKKEIIFTGICVISIISLYFVLAISPSVYSQITGVGEVAGLAARIKYVFKALVNYPYLYELFALYRDTLPMFTFISIFVLTAGAVYLIFTNNKNDLGFRFLGLLSFGLIFAVTFIKTLAFDTRYAFFLFPLWMVLTISILYLVCENLFNKNIRKIVFPIVILIYLMLSEDFNFDHILNVSSSENNFRNNVTREQSIHYYSRFDINGAATIINKNAKDEDLIILQEKSASFYLEKDAVVLADYRSPLFKDYSIAEGKKERWTNLPMIYKTSDFVELLDNSEKTIWLVVNTFWKNAQLNEIDFYNRYKTSIVFTGADKYLRVYKISPAIKNKEDLD